MIRLSCGRVVLICLSALALGCGSNTPPPVSNFDQQAKAKVAAIKHVADAMAKDPNGMDARAAVEDFRMQLLDAAKNPAEAKEIVEVFQKRIKGKYQGEVAVDIQAEVTPIEAAVKSK